MYACIKRITSDIEMSNDVFICKESKVLLDSYAALKGVIIYSNVDWYLVTEIHWFSVKLFQWKLYDNLDDLLGENFIQLL